jgi:Spy/CpxP family protein refolding chaperone
MRLNLKTLGFAVASVGVVLLMTAMVVVSQGQQGPQGQGQGGPGGPPPDGFRRGPGGPRDGIAGITRHLNLSDEQKAQIAKISDAFEASTKELHEQMRALQPDGPPQISTKFDEAAFRASAEARAKIDIELQVAHARAMTQIANVLTEEQRTELATRRQRGPGRPGPGGPPQEQ